MWRRKETRQTHGAAVLNTLLWWMYASITASGSKTQKHRVYICADSALHTRTKLLHVCAPCTLTQATHPATNKQVPAKTHAQVHWESFPTVLCSLRLLPETVRTRVKDLKPKGFKFHILTLEQAFYCLASPFLERKTDIMSSWGFTEAFGGFHFTQLHF